MSQYSSLHNFPIGEFITLKRLLFLASVFFFAIVTISITIAVILYGEVNEKGCVKWKGFGFNTKNFN